MRAARKAIGFELDPLTAANKILVSQEIGDGLRRLREAARCSQRELCDQYEVLRAARPELGAIDEGSLSRIERGVRDRRGRSYVKRAELDALCFLLGGTFQEIEASKGTVFVHPVEQAVQAKEFERVVLREAFFTFGEILSWGDRFIPCAYMTVAFMREHHRCAYSAERLGLPSDLAQRVIDLYDAIGQTIIDRFAITRGVRPFRLVHLMFRNDLEMLVRGTDIYSQMPRSIREGCLDRLTEVLRDKFSKAELWACDDDSLRERVRVVDAMACMNKRFAFWRSHSGLTEWTKESAIVGAKHQVLTDIRQRSQRITAEIVSALRQRSR